MTTGTNWAANYTYRAERLLTPSSVDDVREMVRRSGPRSLRVLGSRHSFNDIADSPGDQLSLGGLGSEITIDEDARTVSLPAGLKYGDLAAALQNRGWAIHNLASLPHISVAGAIATATHGSGDRNGNLATAVRALDLVTANGELVALRQGDPDFAGAVVGLGSLGVVTRLELAVEPSFEVTQNVFEQVPWDAALENFDTITSSGYSVSLFTDWQGDNVAQVWVKRRTDAADQSDLGEFFRSLGGRAATRELHPLPGLGAENCTPQLGVAGAWNDRLPHFRFEFTPSNGEEIQSEYLIDRRHVAAAVAALRGLSDLVTPLLFVSEIRTIAADDLWLSTAHGRDSVALHFTWKRQQRDVEEALVHVEAALAPFDARPHWGKVFVSDAARLAELYPRLPDFRRLRARLDPDGVFRNGFTDRFLDDASGTATGTATGPVPEPLPAPGPAPAPDPLTATDPLEESA